METNRLAGQCHCGRIHFELTSQKSIEAFAPRLCQCHFCRRHGARWISDPDTTARVHLKDRSTVQWYRFGTETADFLLCGVCGVPVAALSEIDGALRGVFNVNAMLEHDFPADAVKMDYDSETVGSRLGRRGKNWVGDVAIIG